MNIDRMRAIDFYAGIPLTFLVTGLVKFSSLFIPAKKIKPKNILFIELSEMGSTILADPAMRKAKKALGASLFFCIFSKNRDSLFLLNTVDKDNIFVMREDSFIHLVTDAVRFLAWIRKRNIDTVVDLELFSRVTALLTGLSGAKYRVGFFPFYNEGLYRGDMLTHKVAYNAHRHISKNFIALVNALISDNGEVPYSKMAIGDEEIVLSKVRPNDDEKERMWGKAKSQFPALDKEAHHLVLVNPNASDLLPQRRWPVHKFSNLIRGLLDYDERAVVLITGAPSEKTQAQDLVQQVDRNRCVNFAGQLRLTELPVLYSIATLLVTNDSGPAHFSAITDIPSFVLYGPETPDLYGSLGNSTSIYAGLACSPCVTASNHRKTPCTDNVCLQVISEESVFEKLKAHLRKEKEMRLKTLDKL